MLNDSKQVKKRTSGLEHIILTWILNVLWCSMMESKNGKKKILFLWIVR
nr:MAG TPA: hypothetical protein [Caudoviricetes sp.]